MVWVAAFVIGRQVGAIPAPHHGERGKVYQWTGPISYPVAFVPISEDKHVRDLLARHGIRNDGTISFVDGPDMVLIVRGDQVERARRLILNDAKAQGYLKFLKEYPIEKMGDPNFLKSWPRYLPGHC